MPDVTAPLIDSAAAVEELADLARQRGRLAFDTEFVWERTYFPKLGVVQVALDERNCHLIDATNPDVIAPLGPVLADPEVEVILHDAPQDLTILRRATGAYPRHIFDTRTAAGFGGMSSVLSLVDLLAELQGVTLANEATRTDWLARPLSEIQIAYALDDVRYLPAVRDTILERIQAREREGWLREEMDALEDPDIYRERDPMEQYTRLKGTGRFSGRDLAVLRELTAWRESEARERDRPRSFILPDKLLLALARRKPRNAGELRAVEGLPDRKLKRYREEILAAIQRGLGLDKADCPKPPAIMDRRPLRALLGKAVIFARKKSEGAELDPPFVATRSEVENLVMFGEGADPEQHRLLRGWRRDLLGSELIAFAIRNGARRGSG